MGVIAQWGGSGLTDGTVFTNSTVGTGDTHLDTVTSAAGTFTIRNGGLYSPRIEMNQQPSTAAQMIWQAGIGGTTYLDYAIRFYFEPTAFSSGGNAQLFSARDSSNAVVWWLDVTPTGIIRLRNAANVAVDISASPLPIEEMRFDAVVHNDAVTVSIHNGESLNPFEVLSGTGFLTGFQQVRFGNPNSAPTWPKAWWDGLAFSNEATKIGPITPPPPTPVTLWDGSTEQPLTVDGVWDGSAVQPIVSTIEIA